MEIYSKLIIEQLVDHLLPELTPYESSMYLYLLRNSFLRNGNNEVRVGKRTIAGEFGKGTRGERTSYAHVSDMLTSLEKKGCINIGNTDRFGTLYTVILPKDIPIVAEKIAGEIPIPEEEDYFTNPEKRKIVFERDKLICQYCGDKLNPQNMTLDHFVPQRQGGKQNT